jgi:hypothetical protein
LEEIGQKAKAGIEEYRASVASNSTQNNHGG